MSALATDEQLSVTDTGSGGAELAVSPHLPHVLRNIAETPPTPGSLQLGARCQYLADCFAQESQIVSSQTDILQKLSKEQISAKIGQIEDWALALGIDETRELERCGWLRVLGNTTAPNSQETANNN